MEDHEALVFSCESLEGFGEARRALGARLPIEVRKRLNQVFIALLHNYGPDGMFERMNGRTVGALLADHERDGGRGVVASGEVDGVGYAVFEAPGEGAGPGPSPAAEG